MTTISINADRCIGCKFCVVVCPEGVLLLRSMVLSVVVDQDKCLGTACMECEKGCPEKAIKVS